MSKYRELTERIIGDTIGRWLVTGPPLKRGGHYYVGCRCQCGTESQVRTEKLVNNLTLSCGCLRDEQLTTHGRTKNSIRKNSKEYWVWNTMKQRCLNPRNRQYPDYGGRGITVCHEWREFAGFYRDMGSPEPGQTLERVDNNKGYGPENCVWTGRAEQSINKRNNHILTAYGESKTLAEWSSQVGVSYVTILSRLKRGWPVEKALSSTKWVRESKL